MYADDTNLYWEIKCNEGYDILQSDLAELKRWSDIRLLKFHPQKCFSLTIGKKDEEIFI